MIASSGIRDGDAGLLFTNLTVEQLPDDIEMTDLSGVLLHQVEQHPAPGSAAERLPSAVPASRRRTTRELARSTG